MLQLLYSTRIGNSLLDLVRTTAWNALTHCSAL